MFKQIGAPEIVLILVVLVLLFGAKRLPDAARGLGRSLRIFKSEVKQLGDDDEPGTGNTAAGGTSTQQRPIEGKVVEPPASRPVGDAQQRDAS
jgi:sec-independent protein translocase protein TatA